MCFGSISKSHPTGRGGKAEVIVSLHLPKTAGTSFAEALSCHFGDRLLLDYTYGARQVSAFGRHSSLVLQCALNKTELPVPGTNVNEGRGRNVYVTDPELRARIAGFHPEDMDLYNRALARRASEGRGSVG
jgi:hypothetical protein